jgi:hypothetical protein
MRLTLTASKPEVEATLGLARPQLAVRLAMLPGSPAGFRAETVAGLPIEAPVQEALAALALGDFEAAGQVIRLLGMRQDPAGRIPARQPTTAPPASGPDAADLALQEDDTPHYLLLLARYLAWTGEIYTLRENWPRILRAVAYCPDAPGHADAAAWGVAMRELALAAESIGEPAAAADFAAKARSLERAPAPGLPPARGPEPGAAAAELVDYYLREVLGAEPDAARNRLVLRPRIPEGWDHLDLQHLCFGDAEITLRYRRSGPHHHFTFNQESGAVPVRIIFEPLLPARYLVAARVDAQEATLDPRPLAGRLLVPVQIVLDDDRTIDLECGEPAGRARISLPVRRE